MNIKDHLPREITREELRQIIESQKAEWKQSLSLTKEGMKALCGMLNTEEGRGLVMFGVGPNGEPKGVEKGDLDAAQLSLAQHIREKFDPGIRPDIQVMTCEGKYIVGVSAQRDSSTPYHEYDGRAFVTEGSSKRQLSVADKQALSRQRSGETSPLPVPDIVVTRIGPIQSHQEVDLEVTLKGDWGKDFVFQLTSKQGARAIRKAHYLGDGDRLKLKLDFPVEFKNPAELRNAPVPDSTIQCEFTDSRGRRVRWIAEFRWSSRQDSPVVGPSRRQVETNGKWLSV